MAKSKLPKPKEEKLTTILSGVAGEYFVAAELSRRGYIASITLRNSKGVDILASNGDASKSVAIQVKTNQRSEPSWVMSDKAERFFSSNHFYVFVNLNGMNEKPDCYIVPSEFIADSVREVHEKWLSAPGKNGRIRKDSSIRKFTDKEKKFLNRWDLLGL